MLYVSGEYKEENDNKNRMKRSWEKRRKVKQRYVRTRTEENKGRDTGGRERLQVIHMK